ncbi:hypothetical protein PGIGA_G00197810 [Pangasianodon gigas]|uniref:Uncharacterized protein n=1 Tax=Pangasianodon gigas TaxID=30993 RepID=A0ACC5WE31_PANGG|nr:hypothetical protein [Pangasianodon gigas]
MGFLGGEITVDNRTPYRWTVCIETQKPWLFSDRYNTFDVGPHTKTQQSQILLTKWGQTIYLKVKYGQCSETECCTDPDLWYIFDPRDDPCFTIRESGDHWYIHLDCNINYEEKESTCPNYERIEDDAREEEENRRRAEEQRRQAQLERERRIEEQIRRESELSAKKLEQATETMKQKQRLRGHEFHHQTHIMQQTPNTENERDEVPEIEKKFRELSLEYQILQDEDSEETLADRMKTLQNELMVEYCKKHNLSSSCVFSFNTAVGYETLPLHDRLTVLEAVMHLVFKENEDDHTHKHDRDFLLDVLELLQDDHPSLAFNLLQSLLQTDMQLSAQSKEILCQTAFNNTWKLAEITDFMRYIFRKDKEQVQSILHIAQTYKLEYGNVFSALDSPDPLRWLKSYVDKERHKNALTIISEMCKANYPENVLIILEDVLGYLEMELPKHKTADLSENKIHNIKKMVKELDFNNPDRHVLKSVLVGMSVAVKICSAVTIQRGKKEIVIEGYLPRLTQLATLVVFLLPKSKTNTGCLLEIGTGEGKSCILAMLSAIHAIRGVKVDIVTSSPVLACRDLEEWRGLYNMFGITSSAVPPMLNDVSSEKLEELTQEAYKQQIIYSTIGTFAADTLKQEFEKKTTRGDRRFELVLVDEVDYMTLDNGVQITFLSHESSGLQHLEQVLAGIWAMVSACRPIEVEGTGETMWATRVQNFHTAALIAMIGSEKTDTFSPLEILLPGTELGFYSEEDFENLQASINDKGEKQHVAMENKAWKAIMAKTGIEQQYDLLSVLEMGMEHKVAFNCYVYQSETRKAIQFGEQKTKTDQNINMLLLENGKACEILSENLLVEATLSQLKSKIKYSKQCSSEEEKHNLVVPSFLEKYLENQLPVLVENALKAIQMTKGREYMIERSLGAQGIDVSEEDQHMYHAIIPVDFQASGMLEKRKRWGDGLQQFLEMKHQLTLSPLSNVTNYMSNSNFFKRYLSGKGIFGVSGTLGGDADKGFLARHYKTDSYVIPAHQRQKVTELPAVQVRGGTEQWIQTLCATVSKVSNRGQVVLVVCEDVNTANDLNDKITAETKHSVTMYTMSENHNIENQEFNKGQIIITTNLGGRGTDIKVTEEVNRCGGLFVLLTYFPNNRRVEKQVFGRTGRKGTPGMVQLILNHDRLAMAYQGHSIEVMREFREEYEVNRIKDMEKEKLAEIEMKEELFSTFCQFLSDFDKHYNTEEKTDLFEVKVKDVPRYFESFHSKMDYHPALNALKESWGIWLILHTEQINIENDLTELTEDLIHHLHDTSDKLLHGQSENFYDHIQQALGRTALHFQNKNKCDYGAKSYWKKASDSDNYYRAIALYNQAYITINMAKEGYKSEARSLLEEAEKAIDVYVSEMTKTLYFCSLSVTQDFEPHHSGSCNFQIQMQARMNIFNSWKRNIRKILDMLGSAKGDFRTVDLTLYSLSAEEDFVSSSELNLFRNYGLAVVFEVTKKPQFSFDALICCFLGLVQVVAGVLICGLTAGSMSSFGLGLISEGVSDMISGVMDDKGKLLTEETYPGTDPAAGAIKLVLTKSPLTSPGNEGILNKLKRNIKAEDIPQSGHIDIIRPDGSRETVKSSNQNCLFHAVIQATTNDPNNVVLQKAKELRRKVSDEILLKPNKYVDAVKIQNIFNMTNSSNKYKIQAGVRECDLEQYTKYTKNKTPKQIIEEYKLGKVGDHKCVLDMEKPTAGVVEAQHIPPKSTWTAVLHLIKTNPEISSSLDRKNKEAFYLMMKMKHDPNGKMQLCMNTLSSDRRRALSSGNSAESRACRHFLTSTFSRGDTEKALKLSLIMAHPQCSDHIWNDLGFHHHFRTCDAGLAVMDRNDYYKRGFKEIVKKYSKWDLIDQDQTIRLIKWVQKDIFLDTSTVEYKEIINVIKDAKKKKKKRTDMSMDKL